MLGEPQISPERRSISAQLRKPCVLTVAALTSAALNGRGGGGGGVGDSVGVGEFSLPAGLAANGEPGRNRSPTPTAPSPATNNNTARMETRRLRRPWFRIGP